MYTRRLKSFVLLGNRAATTMEIRQGPKSFRLTRICRSISSPCPTSISPAKIDITLVGISSSDTNTFLMVTTSTLQKSIKLQSSSAELSRNRKIKKECWKSQFSNRGRLTYLGTVVGTVKLILVSPGKTLGWPLETVKNQHVLSILIAPLAQPRFPGFSARAYPKGEHNMFVSPDWYIKYHSLYHDNSYCSRNISSAFLVVAYRYLRLYFESHREDCEIRKRKNV